jgi:hypothetical protein
MECGEQDNKAYSMVFIFHPIFKGTKLEGNQIHVTNAFSLDHVKEGIVKQVVECHTKSLLTFLLYASYINMDKLVSLIGDINKYRQCTCFSVSFNLYFILQVHIVA